MSSTINQTAMLRSNAAMPEVKLKSNASNAGKLDRVTVDRLASHLVQKLNLDGYEKFVCKAIYWLGQAKVADIADRATRAKKPAHFFTAVCKKEMTC